MSCFWELRESHKGSLLSLYHSLPPSTTPNPWPTYPSPTNISPLSLEPSPSFLSLETKFLHIYCHDGSPWAQRGPHLFLPQVTHVPARHFKPVLCRGVDIELHSFWLVQNMSEAWRIQDWLITISISWGLFVHFLKILYCLPAASAYKRLEIH